MRFRPSTNLPSVSHLAHRLIRLLTAAALITCAASSALALDPICSGGYRPPPGFGRVRFFNGTTQTKPAAVKVRTSPSGTSTPIAPPAPNSTAMATPSVSAHVGWCGVDVYMKAGSSSPDITLSTTVPTSATVLEVHVLLTDAPGDPTRVVASGRALIRSNGTQAWAELSQSAQSAPVGVTCAAATGHLPLADLSLLNNSTVSVAYGLSYGLAGYSSTVDVEGLETAPGLSGGDWASSLPADRVSVTVAASPTQLQVAGSSTIFLCFFEVTGTVGALQVSKTWVEQTGSWPYWVFH